MSVKDIEKRYPFKNLPSEWIGLFAPDNGVIDVQLLLRTLLGLAKDYGAEAKQHTRVKEIRPTECDGSIWEVHTVRHETESVTFKTKKIVIAPGAYINHVLKPSFGVSLDLDIWEMVASYFNVNAGPQGTVFPSKPASCFLIGRYVLANKAQACGSSLLPTKTEDHNSSTAFPPWVGAPPMCVALRWMQQLAASKTPASALRAR